MEQSELKKVGEFEGVVTVEGDGPDIRFADFTAFVYPAEEGGYWAEVRDLPGCITEGDTMDQLIANLNEAIRGWLEAQTPESLTALGVPFSRIIETGEVPPSRPPRVRTLELAA